MASLLFTDCFSSTTLRLSLIHPNRPNRAFLPRRCIDQLSLRSARGRGCILSIRSSSSDAAAMVLDEVPVTEEIIDEIITEVTEMKKLIGVAPGLAVILVGDKTDSYRNEIPVGIETSVVRHSSEEKVLKSISHFNNDPCVHGILVQSPLPSHMDKQKIMNAISVEKDVDGFHPLNIARLAMLERELLLVPCVPKGYIELLRGYMFEIKGKRAVVIGRSKKFCIPIALLLQREDATVTIIHSKTLNPQEITRQADIVISAIGKPNMVRGSWIKPGAVVINVGFSLVTDRTALPGCRFRKVGDICYEEVCKVASAITPLEFIEGCLMPKVMLLSNVLASAKKFHKSQLDVALKELKE